MHTSANSHCQQPIERKTPFIWLDNAIDDFGLTDAEFRLYAHIARRSGKNGSFWETHEGTAAHLGWSLSKVKRALNTLKASRLIAEVRAPEHLHKDVRAYVLTDSEDWTEKPIQRVMGEPLSPDQRVMGEPLSPDQRVMGEPLQSTLDEKEPIREKKPVREKEQAPPSPTLPVVLPKRRNTEARVSPEDAALAKEWKDWAVQQVPHLKATQLDYEKAIAHIRKAKGLTHEHMRGILFFIQHDDFWSSNAISPCGLMKTSKRNGLAKIDNLLASMRNSKAVKRALIEAEFFGPDSDLPW